MVNSRDGDGKKIRSFHAKYAYASKIMGDEESEEKTLKIILDDMDLPTASFHSSRKVSQRRMTNLKLNFSWRPSSFKSYKTQKSYGITEAAYRFVCVYNKLGSNA